VARHCHVPVRKPLCVWSWLLKICLYLSLWDGGIIHSLDELAPPDDAYDVDLYTVSQSVDQSIWFFFEKKMFAVVTAVSWNVCLIYCMRRIRIHSGKWPTILNIVFTSYYHPQKFSPWNFVTRIVFLPCHSTAILTCTDVHLYWEVYLMMRTSLTDCRLMCCTR